MRRPDLKSLSLSFLTGPLAEFNAIDRGADRGRLALLLAMSMVTASLELVSIGLVLPFLSLVIDPAAGKYQTWLARIGVPPLSHGALVLISGGALVGAFMVKNIYLSFFYWRQAEVIAKVKDRLTLRLMRYYADAPLVLHLGRDSAEFVRNVLTFANGIWPGFVGALVALISDGLVAGAIVTLLLVVNPVPTMVAVAILALLAFVQQFYLRRRIRQLGADGAALNQAQYNGVVRLLGGIRDIRIRGCEATFLSHFGKIQTAASHNSVRSQFFDRMPTLISEPLLVAGVVAAAVILAEQPGTDALGGLALLAAAAFRLLPLLNRIQVSLNKLHNSHAGIQYLIGELASPAQAAKPEEAPVQPLRLEREVTVEGVCFRYPNADRPALDHISFTIKRGEFVGIVGPSGGGKSTLLDLLLGLLTPCEGHIAIDGTDLPACIRAWQASLGYVPQDVFILDATLAANVAFGEAESSINRECVRQALAQAQLDDLVAGLPEGIDIELGEDGSRLSGGQRQRVAIARALYHDPQVLMLDEATSALDHVTEAEIAAVLNAMRGTRTIIAIAHRLSTLKRCDKLIFLMDGRIAAVGSYDELVKTLPDFARMVAAADSSTVEGGSR